MVPSRDDISSQSALDAVEIYFPSITFRIFNITIVIRIEPIG